MAFAIAALRAEGDTEIQGAEAAHISGARQYAPLATYLAGRAAAGQSREGRTKVLQGAIGAATQAGAAGGELGVELDS